MDLGIAGRHVIVCAARKGLGKACAGALAREGVSLTIAARTAADIEATATAAWSGLTGYVGGVACQVAWHNVTMNNLLPGPFETDRFRGGVTGRAKAAGIAYAEQLERQRATMPAGRFGDPAEFGDACAYLCSRQAGFITGQNLLLDGGQLPGVF
jgi:3-oxoacyl-[acyl-carrier protein] reductase